MNEERKQFYEGPWRKLTPNRPNDLAGEVNTRIAGSKTGRNLLNEQYGEDNWEFDTSEFDQERQIELEMMRAENKIAMEGLKSVIANNIVSDLRGKPRKPAGDTYVDRDGNPLTGRVRHQVASSPLGHILISPDGDQYVVEKQVAKEQAANEQ